MERPILWGRLFSLSKNETDQPKKILAVVL